MNPGWISLLHLARAPHCGNILFGVKTFTGYKTMRCLQDPSEKAREIVEILALPSPGLPRSPTPEAFGWLLARISCLG